MATVALTRSTGMLVLGIYLIVIGVIAITPMAIPSIVPGVLGLLAGVLILVGR